mmetsp:Transcript_38030/g.151066  ORF Transcript_38030/g.151066 Transcript_38030/m.151066 type:complete len:88 (+) Transcript_38030:60-323(+)
MYGYVPGQYVDPEKGKVVSAVKDRRTLVLRSSSTGRLVYVCMYSLRLGKQKDPPQGPRKYKRRGRCNCNCLLEVGKNRPKTILLVLC